MNWDDLRILMALRDTGTFAGAAARLRINETTVARRLSRIETTLGITMFIAADGARSPTPACEEVITHVQSIAQHVAEIETLKNRTDRLTGRFMITTVPMIAEEILAPALPAFLKQYPGLQLALETGSRNVNFSRWEADFAIRLGKPERGNFKIARLGTFPLALVQPRLKQEDPLTIGYPELLDAIPETLMLEKLGLTPTIRIRTPSYRMVKTMLETGLCRAILPLRLCQNLRPSADLDITPLDMSREIWLLTQNHLQKSPAAKVVSGWLRQRFQADKEPQTG